MQHSQQVNIPTTGAAILAGGRSSRMGMDKAWLRFRPGGPTLIEGVVERLTEAGLGSDLLVVTNSPQEYGFLGLRLVSDDIPGVGPLGGILTALAHSTRKRVLVVACDMPALNPALLRYMAHMPDSADVLIPRWFNADGQERLETLHAVYSRRCIEPIRKRIEADSLKVRGLLEDVSVRYLDESEVRQFDPQLSSFRNVNTTEEWGKMRE